VHIRLCATQNSPEIAHAHRFCGLAHVVATLHYALHIPARYRPERVVGVECVSLRVLFQGKLTDLYVVHCVLCGVFFCFALCCRVVFAGPVNGLVLGGLF